LTIKDQYFKEKNNCVNNNALSMIDLENKILEFKNRETDLESKILEHIKLIESKDNELKSKDDKIIELTNKLGQT